MESPDRTDAPAATAPRPGGADRPPGPPPDPARAARLRAIRAEVAAGTYDRPDRLDAALEGLLADLLAD